MVVSAFPRFMNMTSLPPPSKHMCDRSISRDVVVLPGESVQLQGRGSFRVDGKSRGVVYVNIFPGDVGTGLEITLYPCCPSPAVSSGRQAGSPRIFESPKLSLERRNVLLGCRGRAPKYTPMGTSKRLPVGEIHMHQSSRGRAPGYSAVGTSKWLPVG